MNQDEGNFKNKTKIKFKTENIEICRKLVFGNYCHQKRKVVKQLKIKILIQIS